MNKLLLGTLITLLSLGTTACGDDSQEPGQFPPEDTSGMGGDTFGTPSCETTEGSGGSADSEGGTDDGSFGTPEGEDTSDSPDEYGTPGDNSGDKEGKVCRDADGDGFGDPMDCRVNKAPSSGWVANDEDCDDADAHTHPGAAENEYNFSDCMKDADLDGFGDFQPSNPMVTPGTDCDDSDPYSQVDCVDDDTDEDCSDEQFECADGTRKEGQLCFIPRPKDDRYCAFICKEGLTCLAPSTHPHAEWGRCSQ